MSVSLMLKCVRIHSKLPELGGRGRFAQWHSPCRLEALLPPSSLCPFLAPSISIPLLPSPLPPVPVADLLLWKNTGLSLLALLVSLFLTSRSADAASSTPIISLLASLSLSAILLAFVLHTASVTLER